jgi:hypothetical protein
MHVSTRRQEKRRNRQSGEDSDTKEKNAREDIVGRLEMNRAEELTRSHDIESIGK